MKENELLLMLMLDAYREMLYLERIDFGTGTICQKRREDYLFYRDLILKRMDKAIA